MLAALRPTTDNPTPAGATVTMVPTADGLSLRLARWRPTSRKLKGTLFLFQGRSESIEKYFESIRDFRRRGFHVVAFDWRGQGGSDRLTADPRRGHVDDFLDFAVDIEAVLAHGEQAGLPGPWFGLAHSMGGTALLLALDGGETRLERVVLAAPLAGLAAVPTPPGARYVAAALDFLGLGGMYIPGGGATSIHTKPFDSNILSSDPRRYQRNSAITSEAPELAIGDPTIGWAVAMYRAFDRLSKSDFGARLLTPTLFVTAGADRLVSTRAAMALSDRIRGSAAIEIRGARHELLSEADAFRDQFLAAFDAFIPGEGARAETVSGSEKV
jgi:lysophospholipase